MPFNKTKIKRKSNFCLISALFTFILEWIAWLLSISRWEIKSYITHSLAQASSKQPIAEVCHKLREFGCCLFYLLPWYTLNWLKALCHQNPIKLDHPPQEYPCDWIDCGFETILFIFLNILPEGYAETWISEMLFELYEEMNACEWFLTKLMLAINYWEIFQIFTSFLPPHQLYNFVVLLICSNIRIYALIPVKSYCY